MSLSVPEFPAGYRITFSHHVSLGSSQLWELLGLSLMVTAWQCWGALFGSMVECPSLQFIGCFSHKQTGGMGLGRKVTEEKCCSHHIVSRSTLWPWGMTAGYPWSPGWPDLSGVPSVVTPFSSFPFCPLWKGVTTSSLPLLSGHLGCPSWEWHIYINHLRLLCTGHFFLLLSLLIYSVMY